MLCFHYKFLNEKSFSEPATILTGVVSAGKSRPSQIALSLTGAQKTSFINQSKMKSITSKTTIRIVLDDPKDPIDIIDKVMHHYDRGKSCSQSSTDVPQTTFLMTVNLTVRNASKVRYKIAICVYYFKIIGIYPGFV